MMPTYTFHTLVVTGDRRKLQEFRSYADGFDPCISFNPQFQERFNELCFNNFIQLPDEAFESMTKLERFRKELWGCESDAEGVSLKEESFRLTYKFTTFNTVPRTVIRAMVKLFPELKFSLQYSNERKGWEGAMKVHKDKVAFTQTDKFINRGKI